MAYIRVLGGLAVFGGGCLAYVASQTRHVGFFIKYTSKLNF